MGDRQDSCTDPERGVSLIVNHAPDGNEEIEGRCAGGEEVAQETNEIVETHTLVYSDEHGQE
jgi:hypothetical protein